MSATNERKRGAGTAASTVVAAGAIALVQTGVSISYAALIFRDQLEPLLSTAVGAFILGGALVAILVGWRSTLPGVSAGSQDTVAVLVATLVVPATAELSGDVRDVTALLMVASSSVMIGVTFLLLGRLKLGSLVRFIPHPVVGGFLAGTGWLMLTGGIRVMVNRDVAWSNLGDVVGDRWQYLLPGLALSLFVTLAVAMKFPPLSVSVGIVAATAMFFGVTLGWSSIGAVEAGGWLIGPFPPSAGWQAFSLSDVTAADWGVILGQVPALMAVTTVAVLGLLLNLSAIEVVADGEMDLNHELQVAGVGNLLAGGVGGVGGYHLVGDTTLARRLGVRTRVAPVAAGVLGILVIVAGDRIVELMPRAVAGGILAGLGASLLWGWLVTHLHPARWVDRLLGIGILVVIATFGALEGVVLGVVVAAVFFVIQYGRIDPVRYRLSGRAVRSRVERPDSVRSILDDVGDAIEVVVLDGYLFFGSAMRTVAIIREQCTRDRDNPLAFVVIDVSRVTGMDASAINALTRAIANLADDETRFIIAGADPSLQRGLADANLQDIIGQFDTQDQALEYCEDELLAQATAPRAQTLAAELDLALNGRAEEFLRYCSTLEFPDGEVVIRSGADADSLFLIESGTLTVHLPGQRQIGSRLRKVGPGSILGEMAFVSGGTRTADVVANGVVTTHEFSRDDFDRLRASHPDIASDFQAFLLRLLSARVQGASEVVNELLR